jgi:hypothetical protein
MRVHDLVTNRIQESLNLLDRMYLHDRRNPSPLRSGFYQIRHPLAKGSQHSDHIANEFRQMLCRAGREPGQTPAKGSKIQISVDQILLLEPPQALADLAGPHRANALDLLQLGLRRAHEGLEAAEVVDDVADHAFGQPRHL